MFLIGVFRSFLSLLYLEREREGVLLKLQLVVKKCHTGIAN